jgi:hypothetical protein
MLKKEKMKIAIENMVKDDRARVELVRIKREMSEFKGGNMNNHKKSLLNQTTEKKEAGKIRVFGYLVCLLVLISAKLALAQDLRSLLTNEFKGRTVPFVYNNGKENVVEPYVTKFGRLKRDYKAPFLTVSAFSLGGRPSDIPTAGLAAEHHWMSFEILMKAQREYAACVAAINENLRRLGAKCMIDQPCNSLYDTVMDIREYWVPFNIVSPVWENTAPSKQTFIDHFEAGIIGVNTTVYHVGLCNQTLEWIRGVK